VSLRRDAVAHTQNEGLGITPRNFSKFNIEICALKCVLAS